MKHAVVVVIQRNGRFLYIERGPGVPYAGYWTPPSGSIEDGERPGDAVVREMQEELGITVAPSRKVWECPSHDGVHSLHWWLAELLDGEPAPDGSEVSRVRWLTPGQIARLDRTFADDLRFFTDVWPALGQEAAAGHRRRATSESPTRSFHPSPTRTGGLAGMEDAKQGLPQEPLISRVVELCANDVRLDAALTYGSFPQGEADEHSDIEFWLFFREPVDAEAWIEQVAATRLVAVNEFGTHVALFAGGVRGEFHFADVADIDGVRDWPGLGAPVDDVVIVDRRGALAEALAGVAGLSPGPDDVANLCARFATWLVFGRAVLARGELLRAHEILGILHRHLLWMARAATGRTEHWLTPSRAAERDLPPEVIQRLTGTTTAATRPELTAAYQAAAAWGAELAAALGVEDAAVEITRPG